MRRKAFLPLGFFVLVLFLAGQACAVGEGAAPSDVIPEPTQTISDGESLVPVVPAVPERRLLTLDYPPQIRAGDSDVVRLTLQVDETGNLIPTAVVDGNVTQGEVIEIPNLYESHHVIVEARFDVAGLQVSPPDLSSQTLLPGQTVMFFWSVRPQDVGIYKGTVWLFLRFVDKASGEESQRAVSAQPVEIEAVNLFGIPANVVRVVGGVGSVVGAVVGFPFFEDIVRYLVGRKKKAPVNPDSPQ